MLIRHERPDAERYSLEIKSVDGPDLEAGPDAEVAANDGEARWNVSRKEVPPRPVVLPGPLKTIDRERRAV